MKTWYTVVDMGAHEGYVTDRDEDDDRAPNGPHGLVVYDGASEDEAKSILAEMLTCNARETGTYCYAHNPNP